MAETTASILPSNLSELEHKLESLEQRLTDLNIPIEQLWDPETCPEVALPYLAWALSVDVWDPRWPVDVKRQVIAAAPELHRIKGTPKAVKLALTQLGFDFDYSEWWQKTPQGTPGTFDITAYINRNLDGDNELLGAESLSLIQQLIDSNKRATAHYTFNLGLGLEGLLNQLGGIEPVRGDADHTLDLPAIQVDEFSGSLAVSGSKNTRVDSEFTIESTPTDKEVPGNLFACGSLYQYQTLDLTIG